METSRRFESNAFRESGKHYNRNTLSVSENPLFIDASGKDSVDEGKPVWQTRKLCLLHGEIFRWKSRCARCHYMIRFQTRSVC